MSLDPVKEVEQAALAKLNQEKPWLIAHKAWLATLGVAFVLGFLVAKLV